MQFLKKNLFFVILCAVFTSIALGLSGYKLYTVLANQEVFQIDHGEPAATTPVDDKTTEFKSFSGEYEKSSGYISFYWNLEKGDKTVTSVRLYYVDPISEKDVEMLEVSDYSSYRINASLYQVLPGSNTFKIKAFFSDGTNVETSANVSLPRVLDVTQTIKSVKEGEARLVVSYRYGKNNEVKEPRIIINGNNKMNYRIVKTDRRTNNNFVIVTQEYAFTWNQGEVIEPFTIRWYFADIELNKDFTTDFSNVQ